MAEIVKKGGLPAILKAPIRVCCPKWWNARKECTAWFNYQGVAGPMHGCGKDPGHSGDHVCPCGARKRRKNGNEQEKSPPVAP